jgi:hypothetical protein
MIDPIVTKVKGFLMKPVETFRQSRNDELGVVLTYFAALLLFNAILSAIVGAVWLEGLKLFSGMMGGMVFPVRVFFMALAGGFIFTLIFAVWLHLWVSLFGGRKGIMQTFKAIMYGNTPHLLLGWLPFIGFIFMFWSLILGIIGIRELHEISTVKAILIIAIAVIIPLIIIILFAVFFNPSNMYFYPSPGYTD